MSLLGCCVSAALSALPGAELHWSAALLQQACRNLIVP
jgi:hypothetical protein